MATKMMEAKAEREYREALRRQNELLEQQAQVTWWREWGGRGGLVKEWVGGWRDELVEG